jgi:N-methylhydantoinase A
MSKRLGIDIGGTFTDFALIGDAGVVELFKTSTTPHAPEEAIKTGLSAMAQERGQSVEAFLGGIDRIVHGSTIGLNAVVKGDGPRVGLLTTEGFRDVLYLRDGHKPNRYNLQTVPPEPLVPRYLRLGIRERIDSEGKVVTALDEQSVRAGSEVFRREGVESIAVSFLWSMLNPAHEQRARAILAEELPGVYVALSSDVLPAIREYPRTAATVLSAYVGPILGPYLRRLDAHLKLSGYGRDLLVMQVTGGAALVAEIEERPVLGVVSGPAAGPAAAAAIGNEEGERDLMLVEMGGTSFDVSLVSDGATPMSTDLKIGEVPLGVAAVDVHSIGAGGGSVAWVDGGGMLRVGPMSAGADPGPACYGRGGTKPTVTDADVVLGYLNPDNFLGGRMRLDVEAAESAIWTVAEPLGMTVHEAAAAIYEVVNTKMVGAMRAVSVMRGIDPRRYMAVVGGGAGGTHGSKIAEDLGMSKAICPRMAGALCAFGMLVADVRHGYLTTRPMNTASIDADEFARIFAAMEHRAVAQLRAQGFKDDAIVLERAVDAKYPHQAHEITIPAPAGAFDATAVAQLTDGFHARHKQLYNYDRKDMPVDINGWRVNATGKLPAPQLASTEAGSTDPGPASRGTRPAHFAADGGFVDTRVFDGGLLRPGMVIEGRAIVELPTTTIVLFGGHRLTVNPYGDYHIDIEQQR